MDAELKSMFDKFFELLGKSMTGWRAYFAAHAPEVPEWFYDGEPLFNFSFPGCSYVKKDCGTCLSIDVCHIKSERTEKYNEELQEFELLHAEWKEENFFKWRWYYAKKMIEAGERKE